MTKLKDKDWETEMVKLILNYRDTLKLSQFMVVFVDDLILSERKKAVKEVLKELEGKIKKMKIDKKKDKTLKELGSIGFYQGYLDRDWQIKGHNQAIDDILKLIRQH